MITKTYTDKEGKPYAIYHRAGTVDNRKDEKYAWTHPIKEQGECSACQSETIPAWVRSSSS